MYFANSACVMAEKSERCHAMLLYNGHYHSINEMVKMSKLPLRAVGSFYQARGFLFKIADGFPRLPVRSYVESSTIHVVMSWGSMSGIRSSRNPPNKSPGALYMCRHGSICWFHAYIMCVPG